MSTIGERLRDERDRLGLNQTAFAEAGGVQKRAQINYEKDERQPDAAYLAAISAAGVDVLYVLTGARQDSNVATSGHLALPADEQLLLDAYRSMPATRKKQLLADLLTGGAGKKSTRKAGGGVSVAGNNNRAAGRDLYGKE